MTVAGIIISAFLTVVGAFTLWGLCAINAEDETRLKLKFINDDMEEK